MKALVTGSAGFIGRHMAAELWKRGYEVTVCDLAYAGDGTGRVKDANRIFNPRSDSPKGKVVYDLVVHCAYNVGGRASIDGVNTNFAKNVQLDAAMFEWAVRTGQGRVLYFSSSAAYPVGLQTKDFADYCSARGDDPRLKESAINLPFPICFDGDYGLLNSNPDSNYGWAKLTGERLAEDARKNGLAVTVVRPFSGYGEDQSLDYPFPSIVKRARSGDLTVWGPPGQTRDWIHIGDVVKGALAVVEQQAAWVDIDGKPLTPSATEPVNLCTGRGVEMGELAQMVYAADRYDCASCYTAPAVPEPVYDESKPTGVFYRVGDPTRMLRYYTPQVTLEEGIERALRALS